MLSKSHSRLKSSTRINVLYTRCSTPARHAGASIEGLDKKASYPKTEMMSHHPSVYCLRVLQWWCVVLFPKPPPCLITTCCLSVLCVCCKSQVSSNESPRQEQTARSAKIKATKTLKEVVSITCNWKRFYDKIKETTQEYLSTDNLQESLVRTVHRKTLF